MKLKILVVSKHKWRSRLRKHKKIIDMMQSEVLSVQIKTIHKDLGTPEIKLGRISEEWFEKNVSVLARQEDCNFVIFHFSEREGKKWGVDSALRGSNYRDGDLLGEAWICADEKSLAKFDDGSFINRYEKVLPHEVGHELKAQGYTHLDVHTFDYKDVINKIGQFYRFLPIGWKEERPASPIIAKVKSFFYKYEKPLKTWIITQAYGIEDRKTYPKTGRHIGTDFRAALGTAIYAPHDGKITRTGTSDVLGNWLEFEFANKYMVALHLTHQPVKKEYKKGDIIGNVGSTGKIFGVHAHLEGWNKPMDRASLTDTNWNVMTFDITELFT